MPARVQREAEAMCGTMTAFSHSASPGFIFGSSSNTSRPTLHSRACPTGPQAQSNHSRLIGVLHAQIATPSRGRPAQDNVDLLEVSALAGLQGLEGEGGGVNGGGWADGDGQMPLRLAAKAGNTASG